MMSTQEFFFRCHIILTTLFLLLSASFAVSRPLDELLSLTLLFIMVVVLYCHACLTAAILYEYIRERLHSKKEGVVCQSEK